MKRSVLRIASAALLAAGVLAGSAGIASAAESNVTRATLKNGMRIVVVRNTLAPVVTAMLHYRVGSNDQTIAGLAHAVEHTMFRGSRTLSSSQLMDTVDITGGNFDADTQAEVTRYFFTVPSQYLDIALRLERSRATGLLASQAGWEQERGAITQEVTQDNSNAFYRLFVKTQNAIVGGTPYAHNTLGTVNDFAHTIQAPQLQKFYATWYHPNNAIYLIVGNVDPQQTIAKIGSLFGDIPSAKLPTREPVNLRPVHSQLFRETSDQPFTLVLKGYRFPGFDSKDYAATEILSDILNSGRGEFANLVASGKGLGAEFQIQSFPKASVGVQFYAVPVTMKPEDADKLMRDVLNGYAKNGVPADLVQASKQREVAQLEYSATSIEGQAELWSQAVAVQGLVSPQSEIEALNAVTVSDVNRVAREYLNDAHVITGYAVPKNAGAVSAGSAPLAKENNAIPPSKHQPLPPWAQSILANLSVPAQTTHPIETTLPNGVKLVVQPEHSTNAVLLSGDIANNPQVQEPAGKEGVSDVMAGLFTYGSTSLDRIAFQTELDKIAANEQAGTSFSVQSLSKDFDRAVELLADNELHPRFEQQWFDIVKQQQVGALTGSVNSPDHLAEVAMNTALYPANDPLTRFSTPTSAGAVTLDDVKAWYANAYRPDLATIVVIGNVTPDQARATVAKYFGDWKSEGPKPNVFPPPAPPNKAATVNVPATGRVQSSVRLSQTIGLLRTDTDFAPMQVANTILTGGFYSSLLYHDLREVHGYVYNVNSSLNAGKVRSTFSVGYGSNPDKVLPAEQLVITDLQRMQTQPVEADRLLRAKAQLMGELPLREASYDQVAGQWLYYSRLGLPLDQSQIDARRALEVTSAQLQAAMRKWVRPGEFVRVVTGPASK
ncbi:MAG: insulinase family protein [Candidatus Eremiobacteraeota bacterium]|nr:insulinase family protein [Candidatus Eremiobacteraeota bacterium]